MSSMLAESMLAESMLAESMLAESMLAESMLAESMLADTNTDTDTNAETSFIIKNPQLFNQLKHESIDRLYSLADDLPKYKETLKTLIANFTIEDMLYLMNTIYRDHDFKNFKYYKIYNTYFDEIEELTHKYIIC
jgi:hypothetical protein